jgi:diguanylate cyclase (GGDEF)-like protein
MSPVFFSLRFIIPLLLLLFAVAWGMYTLGHDTHAETVKLEEAARLRLVQGMTGLQRKLEHMLAIGDQAGVQLEITPMGSDPDLRYALLSDDQDRILYATRTDWVGQTMQEVFPAINTRLIAEAKQTLTGAVLLSDDRNSLMGYYPIILGARPGELRPNRVGILFILNDLSASKLAALRSVEGEVLKSTLILMALSGMLALIFHFTLTRRVAKVVTATERLAGGDLSAQTGLTGNDELARIGQAFDQMARKIEADSLRLQESRLLLEHQALHDVLTDLPNRALIEDRLQQAILRAKRQTRSLALLIMDLDGFKEVNDTLGHHMGDLLLQQVAMRLQNTLRKSDTVARLGGDEFAVLLSSADAEKAVLAAHKILDALKSPFPIQGHSLDIGGSIGIALFPAHGADGTTLVRRADVAMYVAKRANTGYAIYDSEHDQHSMAQLALTGEFGHAIENQQLAFSYQPKIDLKSGCVVSAEALVRWYHPQQGLIMPDKFIPIAERTGLIKPLTQWGLNTALRQCASWREAGLDLSVAVNLSARNLPEPQLAENIARMLENWSVPAGWLELEITESAIMTDPVRALNILTRLDAMGVRLAIDDFGTGYSSLSYLKKLPVDSIKIDKSFVMHMSTDKNDEVIVRSTIDLAHNLDLRVVAEGVERQEAWEMLNELGCDMAQGYYISQALAAAEFAAWLKDSPWRAGSLAATGLTAGINSG